MSPSRRAPCDSNRAWRGAHAVLLAGVLGCIEPGLEREGYFDLVLISFVHDLTAAQRYDCEIYLPLDIRGPLPDSCTTTAKARGVRRVARNDGSATTVDTVLSGVVVTLVRWKSEDLGSAGRDSARVELGGALSDTLFGAEAVVDGDSYHGNWDCDARVPLANSEVLRNAGYRAALSPGDWDLHLIQALD